MYTKQEISRQKQAFWTAFGKYMKPILSADGEAISWINYKTGVKGISFKMEAGAHEAFIGIVLTQPARYDRLGQLRRLLEETLQEADWIWQADAPDEYGKPVSSVSKELPGVSIFRQEDWPAIISFLKPRIIALDTFWSMAKAGFED